MWKMIQILFGIYLLILAAFDIRSRRIPVWILTTGGIGVMIYRCIRRELPLELYVLGALVGGMFLVISKVTKEGFGYGDSLLILIIGIGVGFWDLISLLVFSFAGSAVVAAVALVIGKFQRKMTLPFVPFLGMGYFLVRIAGGG